ncbi:hypothetical protein Ahy_A03g015412 isoform C [Arachis hypogaea]|uniref:Uncharacterized protein n=1 Tax=Arachis hypogaea TaxID=3818 RepID=A0A445E0L2_ARAHY|nr:hypothetical protein Ahy_A03g015412 isoform C [Arachis hypogaea]
MLELQNLKNNLVLGLCKKLQAAGWPIVLLSRGNGSDRNVTVDNLGKARFRSCWSSLMMRSNIYIQHNISYSFTNLSEVASSQVSEDILVERVVGRRLDPITGKIYHLKYSPPEIEEIAARLTQRFDDTEEKA